MSASFDNRKIQDLSAAAQKEHVNRPGVSDMAKESLNMDPHQTIYERSAMQTSAPITSQEASQLSMPSAISQPIPGLQPEKHIDIISGKVGYTKNLALAMMDKGFVADPKAFQAVSHSGNNSFASSQYHFQSSGNSQSPTHQPQGTGSIFKDIPKGQNPLKQILDLAVRSIIDWLF